MIARYLIVLFAVFAGQAAQAQEVIASTTPAPSVPVSVIFETTLGNIRVELAHDRAPVTTNNFLRYVDAKRFDGIAFYRAVAIGDEGKFGLVQAGLRDSAEKLYPPIAHESPAITGLTHLDGTISMARFDPGTATADFFFVVGDLTSLDGKPSDNDPGYAAFGRVAEGMDIVRQILVLPRDPEAGVESGMKGQMLASPVKVLSIRRAQ